MRHPLRAGAVALALVLTPSCAALRPPELANPVAAARTADLKALALIETYAAVLEEAGDLIRDPTVPVGAKRAIIAAERAATPAVDLVRIATVQTLRARADLEAARLQDRPALERASAALAIAAVRLDEALASARGPMAALSTLVARKPEVR